MGSPGGSTQANAGQRLWLAVPSGVVAATCDDVRRDFARAESSRELSDVAPAVRAGRALAYGVSAQAGAPLR
jgi:hypothetical protein